jgi:hypothetical protein
LSRRNASQDHKFKMVRMWSFNRSFNRNKTRTSSNTSTNRVTPIEQTTQLGNTKRVKATKHIERVPTNGNTQRAINLQVDNSHIDSTVHVEISSSVDSIGNKSMTWAPQHRCERLDTHTHHVQSTAANVSISINNTNDIHASYSSWKSYLLQQTNFLIQYFSK